MRKRRSTKHCIQRTQQRVVKQGKCKKKSMPGVEFERKMREKNVINEHFADDFL